MAGIIGIAIYFQYKNDQFLTAGNFVKLIAHDGVLVGATSMGPTGGEVLGLLVLAVHARVCWRWYIPMMARSLRMLS